MISYDKRSETCDNYLPLEELSFVSTQGLLLNSSYLQNKVSLELFWKVKTQLIIRADNCHNCHKKGGKSQEKHKPDDLSSTAITSVSVK